MPKKKEPLYVVRNSHIHGRGVFAARTIRKGTCIVEYVGEKIKNDEADKRYDEANMRRHHTFLFTLSKATVVDGSPKTGGGDASYINHSCEPNCEALIGGGKIHIYALQTIYPGTELLYDYQYELTNNPKDLKYYVCRCGADSCRGTIMKAAKRKRTKPKKSKKQNKTSRRKRRT